MFVKSMSRNRARAVCALVGLLLTAVTGSAAAAEITGKVDDSGDGLPGASIQVQGTETRTVSGSDGSFSIEASEGAVLLVSLSGFEPREVPAGDPQDIVLNYSLFETITVLGSHGKPRSALDRPVPVDVITLEDLNATGQIDLAQSLHYAAPSFSAVKFGINDLAPLIDPASLRGLAPDQTLLLVNGKRRHKVSFFSLNHGVGKGQLGNDINAIPSAAIKRVEILRDGAAAPRRSTAPMPSPA